MTTRAAGLIRRRIDLPNGPLAALESHPDGESLGTVLLVPGFTGSKEDFRFVLPLLAAAGWLAISIDQRGQYESPGPDDAAAYSVPALGRDLLQVVARLDAGPLYVVGHSFGGLVTRSAVLQRPAAFAGHVLMDSGPAALPAPRADVLSLLRPILDEGGLVAVWEAMQAVAAGDPRRIPVPIDPLDFQRTRLLGGSAAGLKGMGDALLTEPDRVAELAATGVRTLVVYGERDDAWPPSVQAQMADRLGAEAVIIRGSIHSPAAENPADTARALTEFFSRQ